MIAHAGRQLCCLIALCLAVLVVETTAKPRTGKPVTAPPTVDFSELDKLVPEELKEKNTPGAVITVVSGDQVVYQKAFGIANVETNAQCNLTCSFVSAQRRRCSRRSAGRARRKQQDQAQRTHRQPNQRP